MDQRVRKRPDKSGNCAVCGMWRKVLCRDHIKPRREGGGNELSNIQWLCANCHQDKSALEQSAAHKGRPKSPEQRAKMSAWQIGVPKPAELRAKIARTLTGHVQSAETRAKRSASMKISHEHRAKINAAFKARAAKKAASLNGA